MEMSKKEYKRHEWRLVKVYDTKLDEMHFEIMYKVKYLWFFTGWHYIYKDAINWCKYPDENAYTTMFYSNIAIFKDELLARDFINFYEKYREKMYKIEEELSHPYIEVK